MQSAGKLYLAGPMTGIPKFNFPLFNRVAAVLRDKYRFEVFNPAEEDIKLYGVDPSEISPEGDPKLLAVMHPQFSLRQTLFLDMKYICLEATHMCFLPGWEKSNGAMAEHRLGVALGHTLFYWHDFMSGGISQLKSLTHAGHKHEIKDKAA